MAVRKLGDGRMDGDEAREWIESKVDKERRGDSRVCHSRRGVDVVFGFIEAVEEGKSPNTAPCGQYACAIE